VFFPSGLLGTAIGESLAFSTRFSCSSSFSSWKVCEKTEDEVEDDLVAAPPRCVLSRPSNIQQPFLGSTGPGCVSKSARHFDLFRECVEAFDISSRKEQTPGSITARRENGIGSCGG
jgi:hypothetical protein